MTTVVETRGLSKEFKGGRGVREIDLAVEEGEIFGFLGPNGAGKSTFVKMLVGLLHPTSGEARVLGLPAGDLRTRKRIGYLPELFRYQEWLTATEVLWFHARLCGLDRIYAKERIRQVIRDVGLSSRESERIRNYSKGMQQRLGLACALLPEPEVLFLDEPASALDPGGRHEVRQLLGKLRDNGTTVFLNTHLLEDVESVCSRVALLIDGKIRASGSVHDILHPEPVFDFTVAGWDTSVEEQLNPLLSQVGISVSVNHPDSHSIMNLAAKIANEEQVAWLNDQLVQAGVSVYSIVPRTNRLESWFLTLTDGKSGEQI